MNAPAYATYLTDAIGPLPFCPGCGHDQLVKAVDKALVKLQPDPKNVVIVTDIGCIGLADRYFVTNGFHGLHGRSITYACGLKLARPELTVIVLKGDGGCGIGGAHFLNVARRNIGITLIVANNFNYGMTGGQHSVTTPTEGITATTPWGNVEGALDLCAIAIAAGAPWAYRGTSYDKDLPDRIAEAIERPDFAMLDIWEMCTAYYLPRNELKKKDLFDLFQTCGMNAGLLQDKPRPEYGDLTRTLHGNGESPLKERRIIEPKHPNALERQIGIVIAGSAGQKIRSSATTFAQGAMFADLKATQKDDYPITVMTGHSSTEIIVSPEPVDYTAIETPDCVVVLSADGVKKAGAVIARLPATSTVYIDDTLAIPETAARVIPLPLARTAKGIDRLSVATVALAAVLRDQELFPLEALKESISAFQAPAVAEINLKAGDA